jgi:class 3 adenylate cyclase
MTAPASTPWHRRLSVQLLGVFIAALAAVTAADLCISRAFLRDMERTVVEKGTSGIEAVVADVSQELRQDGEAVIDHAAHELLYRALAYLRENPRSRGLRSPRALADFCIKDEGFQRLANRKFMEYGYSIASVAVGSKLIVVAHGRKDLLGRDLYAVTAGLTAEERRLQRADEFEEDWKDRRTGGISFEQTTAFRPRDIPAAMTKKYGYDVWGEFNGIPLVFEMSTYIDEFRRSISETERKRRQALAELSAAAQKTAHRRERQLLGVSLALFALMLAGVLSFSRTWLERPISAIVRGLKAYGAGDFKTPIRTGARNELKSIEDMSNVMAEDLSRAMGSLKELNATLEERVAGRTRELAEAGEALRQEKEQSEALLRNVLPDKIARRLKEHPGEVIVEDYAQVSVLFTDFKGFTQLAESATPERLIFELNEVFGRFDELAARHGMEKIKTIGDAYFAVGGLPERNGTHPCDAVALGLDIRDYIAERRARPGALPLQVRIGIHSGPVIAGIIGRSKFAYDLWGDTVNIASRMESSGEPGRVNVSEATYNLVKARFACTSRGALPVKGKGEVAMYFVERQRPAA